jgi:hypothetical protein
LAEVQPVGIRHLLSLWPPAVDVALRSLLTADFEAGADDDDDPLGLAALDSRHRRDAG